MSATATATHNASRAMREACDKLAEWNTDYGRGVLASVLQTLTTGAATGTMKAWMHENDGAPVETVQVDIDRGTTWAPGSRSIKAGATFALFAGSRRDYAGMHVVATSPACLIVSDGWHVVAYVVKGA